VPVIDPYRPHALQNTGLADCTCFGNPPEREEENQ
jgi:hypothetical protein